MIAIKIIDVFGQFNDKGTDHYYVYSPIVIPDTSWKRYINDPRELPSGLEKSYAIWCTPDGWWLSVIKKNPHDSRGGWAMVSVCIGGNRPEDGKEVITLLDLLSYELIDKKIWDDANTEDLLIKNVITLVPCSITPFTLSGLLGNPAYRTYSSEAELISLFTFLAQDGYCQYSRIFIVSSESANVLSGRANDITSSIPIRKILTIKTEDPSTTKVSYTEVYEGAKIKVGFIKNGYEPTEIIISVDNKSKFGYIDGNNFVIYSPAKANIIFYRLFYIQCVKNDSSQIVNPDIIKVDGKTLNKYEGYYSVKIQENNNSNIKIEAYLDGYTGIKSIDGLNIRNGETITIKLKPKGYKLHFQVMGHRYITSESIIADSLEYDDLIKCGAVFNGKELVLSVNPQNNGKRVEHNNPLNNKKENCFLKHRYVKFLSWLLTGVLLLYFLYFVLCCIFQWPIRPFEGSESPELTNTPEEIAEVIDSNNSQEQQFEKEDIMYLKKSNYWDKRRLNSQKYQMLLDFIHNGQIDEILKENPWFPGNNDSINGFWIKNISYLSKIQNDLSKKNIASDELKRIANDINRIDMNEMCSCLKNIVEHDRISGGMPSFKPTDKPTTRPTDKPATKPTDKPAIKPTDKPTTKPAAESTAKPKDSKPAKDKENGDPRGKDNW